MTDPRMSRRQFVALPAAAACLMLPSVSAFAQNYPSRPIKIVVPSPPGGTTDLIGRLIANQLQAAWTQPVLVENKPGAGLRLGADYVAKSAPDGYTLLMAAVHHSIAQAVYKKNSYDLQKDLVPISIIANVPNVLIVSASLPVKNVQEFIALAKSQPGKISYGSTGYGTAHHLIGEQFNDMAGTQLLHVPYKGSAPAITDLMGGQIHAMFDTASSCLPYITSGKVRALAVTSGKRSMALPDVPTLSESGLTGFDIATWFGLMAPAGTPKEIVAQLQTEIARILAVPEIRQQLSNAGAEPVGSTSEQMGRQIDAEIQRFSALAKKINLELD
ncbi:Bug family tripartite tricarboxylate transporter substrate binding protein [Bordetella genomosp. 4]|uniref:Bug family tripartite tricarboxylate transporter substrate binding protein n=1 Tax=Bordetella genomosp. 4 TaxID=463044 RepID=UPI000B9ECA6D|nr:tripartite tricarboxylate transporter substrate binding protein [Bordetella genomosp. 4]OZI47103.1 MFS transporter [Bordetella genomosp. 4]